MKLKFYVDSYKNFFVFIPSIILQWQNDIIYKKCFNIYLSIFTFEIGLKIYIK